MGKHFKVVFSVLELIERLDVFHEFRQETQVHCFLRKKYLFLFPDHVLIDYGSINIIFPVFFVDSNSSSAPSFGALSTQSNMPSFGGMAGGQNANMNQGQGFGSSM